MNGTDARLSSSPIDVGAGEQRAAADRPAAGLAAVEDVLGLVGDGAHPRELALNSSARSRRPGPPGSRHAPTACSQNGRHGRPRSRAA